MTGGSRDEESAPEKSGSPSLALAVGRRTLAALEPYLARRRYRAGHVLWTEGETFGRLVLLDQGRVKIVRAQPDGRSVLLHVFGPGTVFGFLPFLDGGPYPATAVTLEDVEARVMSRADLLRVIDQNPRVCMLLFEELGQRLRQAFARIDELSQRSATVRVAAALAALLPAGRAGPLQVIEIPRPGYGFAEEIGVTPETLSRALSRLVEAGVLHRLGPGRLQVLDGKRLKDAAAGDPGFDGHPEPGAG